MPRKSEWWIKNVSDNLYGTPNVISTKDMVSDLTYAKTTTLAGKRRAARWLLAIDEPDLKVMVKRDDEYNTSSEPTVITYRRKEDE